MKKSLKMLILSAAIGLATVTAQAQVGISVRIGPPALPVYVQPPCPVDGYLWQPGYWAYDDADGYYWVPGEWVAPPDPGLLWTPCYWGWSGGLYVFHAGYWGPHVGFYGGINYGFGYPGSGFYGGAWSGRSFRYNTAVFNVNRTVIHNTYVNRSFPRGGSGRVSFNGGPGGVRRSPSATERRFSSESHVAATHAQMEHQQNAGRDPGQRFSTNHGRPANAAGHGGFGGGAAAGHPAAGMNHGAAHAAPGAANHEAHAPNAAQNHGGFGGGRPAEAAHPQANHEANAPRANHEMNNAPRPQQQHASQPEQHVNRAPSQPQQHMGGGGFGGGRPAGGPPAGGMPHGGGGFGGGGGHPMGGGGGGHPMGGGGGAPHGGGGGHGGGGHHP